MSDMLNPEQGGSQNEGSADTGASSVSGFNESSLITSLKEALPVKEQALQQASIQVPLRVEEASERVARRADELSTLSPIDEFEQSVDAQIPDAQDARESAVREAGANVLGSLQRGTVRLGNQIYNLPSTSELRTRLDSLSDEEVSAINEVRRYETKRDTLNKAISSLVNNTDLDPLTREVRRGAIQRQLDTLPVPEEAYARYRASRVVGPADVIGGPATQQLAQTQGSVNFGTTLQDYVAEIDAEYADIQENDAKFEEFKSKVSPELKQLFNEANEEYTREGLEQASRGAEAFSEGDYASGALDVLTGSIKSLGGSFEAAVENPSAIAEIVTETAPQMAAAFVPYLNALTNTAYVGGVYKEAVLEYEKENNGELPSREDSSRMAAAAIGAGILEVAADRVLVSGTGKIADSLPDSVKSVLANARSNSFVANAVTRVGARAGASAITEGATEAGQTALEEVAKGNEVSGSEVSASAIIGAAAGSGFAGGAQAVSEVTNAAKSITNTATEAVARAAQEITPTQEEVRAKSAERTLSRERAGKSVTTEQRTEVVQAQQELQQAQTVLNLLRTQPGVSEENIKRAEERVNKLQARAPSLSEQTADTSKITNPPEEQSSDEYLQEVSYQMAFDDGSVTPEVLQTAIDTAIEKGATEEDVAQINEVLKAKKSSKEVSTDIVIGSENWRGGGTYINNIIVATNYGNTLLAATNLTELKRFDTYITTKADQYSKALDEAKRLGRSVQVINPIASAQLGEDVPYETLEGTPAWVSPRGESEQLVLDIAKDAQILSGIAQDGQRLYDAGGFDGSAADVLAQYVPQAPETETVTEEGTSTDETTSKTQEAAPEETTNVEAPETDAEPVEEPEQVLAATTEKVEQDLEPVARQLNPASPDEVANRPDSADVIARAIGSTKSVNIKAAIRELGKRIDYKNEFGTNTTPLDSSIPEKYYDAGLEAIQNAIDNPEFGKQKEKTSAELQMDNMVQSYEETGRNENMSEADVAFLTTNEFVEEARVNSFVANEGITPISIREQAKKVGVTEAQTASVMRMLKAGYTPIADSMEKRFNKTVTKAKGKKNKIYTKANSNWLSNFEDNSGRMVKFLRQSTGIAVLEHVLNNGRLPEVPSTSAVQAFAQLDSKQSVPEKLYGVIAEIGGIGDTKENIIESIGNNALSVAGVRFSGKRGNTKARHQASLGALAFDTLVDMGVLTGKKVSINKLVWAGANYDNNPTVERALKNGAKTVEKFPGSKIADQIVYNDVVYEWSGRYYRVQNQTNQGLTITTWLVNPDAKIGNMTVDTFLKKSTGLLNPYSKLFTTERNKRTPAMVRPRKNTGNIKGYEHKRLNKTQRAAQDKQSEQALYLNRDILSLVTDFGQDRLKRIAGYVDIPENTNRVKRLSMEGKNQTIEADLRGFNQFVLDMESEGEVLGQEDIAEIPFYANFFNSAYQRQFVDSQTFNYQSSKAMHRFMAHHGTAPMKLNDTATVTNFKVAVAQGLGIGVDKLSSDTSLQQLADWEAAHTGPMANLVRWLDGEELNDVEQDELVSIAAGEENMHTMLAMVELAKYNRAVGQNQTSMDVAIPIELDGVNNGPVTAILQSITSGQEYDERLKQAGITYADEDTRTHGERAEQGLNGLYEDGAAAFQESLLEVRKNLEQESPQFLSLSSQISLKALNSKLVGLSNGLEIKRNETKGIITKLFYNAGANSLLRGEVDDLVKNFYNELQRVIDGEPDANQSLLMGRLARASTPFKGKDRKVLSFNDWAKEVRVNFNELQMLASKQGLQEFTIPDRVLTGLYTNMREESSYGNIKLQAIRDIYSDAISQSKITTQLTTVGAVFARDAIDKAIAERREELALSRYEALPTKELEGIYSRLGSRLPNLSLDMHTQDDYSDAIPLYSYNKTPRNKAGRDQYSIGDSQSSVYVTDREVTDVGAGAVAASTISVADASTIMGIMQQMNQGFMTVFDGVLINAANMDTLAQAANLAYHKSLRGNNTFNAIYSNFLHVIQEGIDSLSNEKVVELAEALRTDQDPQGTPRENLVNELQSKLDYLEAEALATKNGIKKNEALGDKDLSVDQFGAVNDKTTIVTPSGNAVNPSDALDAFTPATLGELYAQETAEAQEIHAKSVNSSSLAGFINRNWNRESDYNSRGGKQRLLNLVKQSGVPESEYADFLREGLIGKVLAPAFSNIKKLPAIKVVDSIEMARRVGQQNAKGAFVHGEFTIYLNSDKQGVNAETLFHELTHAALDVALVQEGRKNAQFAAEIEALAQDAAKYLQQNSDLITRFTPTGTSVDVLNNRIPWTRDNGSVNTREFLSWSLTNFPVITGLLEAKPENKPTIFGRIFLAIQRLLNTLFKKNRVVEDSIFSYIFASAVKLAPNAARPRQNSNSKSLQETYSDINKADAETTFEQLANESFITTETKNRLHSVFAKEILPVLNETRYNLQSAISNTAETLTDLALSDIDTNPNMMLYKFGMSPAELHTYEMYQKIMASALEDFNFDSRELVSLYQTARKTLKVEDFLLPDEPVTDDAMKVARSKYDAVFTDFGKHQQLQVETNVVGLKTTVARSNYLANFAALSRTSEEFRAVLDKAVPKRKSDRLPDLNNQLEITVINMMTNLSGRIFDGYTGTAGKRSFRERIDKLSKNISAADNRSKAFLERVAAKKQNTFDKAYNLYARAFDFVYNGILNSETAEGLKEVLVRNFGKVPDRFKDTDVGFQMFYWLHRGYLQFLPRLMEEMSSTNDSNKHIRRLTIGKTKAIAGARDGIIKAAHRAITDNLGKLTDTQSKALTYILLDADFATLHDDSTVFDLPSLLEDEQVLDATIQQYEAKLYSNSGTYKHFHVRSAHSLASLMINGRASEAHTLPNAYAIATAKNSRLRATHNVNETEKTIDVLASLVALKLVNQNTKSNVAALMRRNPEGYEKTLRMITRHKQRVIEEQYAGDRTRALKGHFFDSYDSFKDVRFVTEQNAHEFTGSNYFLHRQIQKDVADGNPQNVYIVASKTGGLGAYQQGQYSTINSRLSGINNLDGRFTSNGYDDYEVARKFSKLTRKRKYSQFEDMFKKAAPTTSAKDFLVPVINSEGVVTGYQYTIGRTEREQLLGRDTRFSENLSSAMGRVVEATYSDAFNKRVNQAVREAYVYDRNRGADLSTYTEISNDAPTKRGREAWRMMPPAAREDMKQIWGDKIYVKNSMMDIVYGYRKASLANVFRKNEDNFEWVQTVAKALTRNYKYEGQVVSGILKVEKLLGELSGLIKDAIVIRGVNVMLGNIISNTVQLTLQNDMPVTKAIKLQVEGMRNAKAYQLAQSQLRRLELQDSAIEGIPGYERQRANIAARIAELREELERNPAAPLIKEGLLTAIVEDIEVDNNPFGYVNRLGDWVTGVAANLPRSARWVGDVSFVNKDSELYRTLYMYTQLGDFASRYALYKDIQEREGEVDNDNLDRIVDAFVNYDLPSNKYLQYLGDVGQLWFIKYFFRIQNVIVRNTIQNPRRVLDFFAFSAISGIDISTYFDAFFMFNSITNKMGFFNYAELGIESVPVVQVYDFVTGS